MGAQNKAPDFTLEALSGERVVLSDVLKKQKVVLVFWATWCPFCVKEMSLLEKFYQENQDKVVVMGIDVQESKTKIENFVRGKKISYPIVLDSEGKVATLYNAVGVPTIVVVNQDGTIIYYGHSTKEMISKIEF
jgi:peroxiredoxin